MQNEPRKLGCQQRSSCTYDILSIKLHQYQVIQHQLAVQSDRAKLSAGSKVAPTVARLTSFFLAVLDGVVVLLEQFVKVPFAPPAGLWDHSFVSFQLFPEASVVPSLSQLVQHLIRSHDLV